MRTLILSFSFFHLSFSSLLLHLSIHHFLLHFSFTFPSLLFSSFSSFSSLTSLTTLSTPHRHPHPAGAGVPSSPPSSVPRQTRGGWGSTRWGWLRRRREREEREWGEDEGRWGEGNDVKMKTKGDEDEGMMERRREMRGGEWRENENEGRWRRQGENEMDAERWEVEDGEWRGRRWVVKSWKERWSVVPALFKVMTFVECIPFTWIIVAIFINFFSFCWFVWFGLSFYMANNIL